ncbi:hypothetical protein CASFOL_042454 [Castilleja foliolosa]|uniref:MADS-box domain-containing protein n=1 Tax=Castilleja foliolosa TaxID=1961234 RepID=A0ABD3BC13_9LAMI
MSSSNQAAPPRKSRGRQKVTMVKMSNESNLQVTFSKRRAGLFKKCSELCTLCGSEAAIVVFSPANKVFCFGHPNVQTVIDKFEHLNFPQSPIPSNKARSQLIIEAHRNSTLRELNFELTQVETLLKAEKRRAEELDSLRKSGQKEGWFFGNSFDGFNFGQLRVLKESIMGFKKNLDVKVQNDMLALANPHPNIYPNKGNPSVNRVFGDNNFSDWATTFNKNVQMSLGSNGLNPNYNYHGAIGVSENIGLFGGPKSTGNVYGSIDDEALENPIITNNISTTGLAPVEHYIPNGGGNSNITGFGSYNMAPFDPKLF